LPFIYFGQGVATLYQDFVERLMSQLALRGTEITNKKLEAEKLHKDAREALEKHDLTKSPKTFAAGLPHVFL